MTAVSFQGPSKDFALHTIGWQAFQDLAVSIAGVFRILPHRLTRCEERRRGTGRLLYGLPDEPLKPRDKRQTTIQCKHVSMADAKLTVAQLRDEFTKIRKLVASGRAHGYVLMTNASITEGNRKRIVAAIENCGVTQPYIHGRDWVVAKILEHPRVRALVPRVYGLGDLSWITDKKARDQAEAIIDSMGDNLACYVPTKAHRDSVRALDAHRSVLLLGDPAVGSRRLRPHSRLQQPTGPVRRPLCPQCTGIRLVLERGHRGQALLGRRCVWLNSVCASTHRSLEQSVSVYEGGDQAEEPLHPHLADVHLAAGARRSQVLSLSGPAGWEGCCRRGEAH